MARDRSINRRRSARIELVERIKVRIPYAEMPGRLINLSSGGAAIEILNGIVPGAGIEVAIALRDQRYLWGLVCRFEAGIVAIRFPKADLALEELLWVEHRGWEIYKGIP